MDSVYQKLRSDILPEREARLLEIINAPLAPEARQQRDALLELQKERELTETERETLTELIDAVELANATRWQSLADLAEQRGMSLSEIARELEIVLP
jgi:AraC-like DNA-binding protein